METETIHRAIESVPHWLEMASWSATTFLSIVAIIALIYTARQVHEIRTSNAQTATNAHASFLLELDHRWESGEMHSARTLFYELRQKIETEIETSHAYLTDHKREEKVKELFSKYLFDMMLKALTDYVIIMRLCGFLETMGYLVKKEYVSFEDIDSLFGGAVLNFDDAFRLHINKRQSEKGVPAGFYEHALSIADRCRAARSPT